MSAIAELERTISNLAPDGLPARLSTYAALQIVDAHTLVVVVFANRNATLIEQTITSHNLGAKEITVGRGVITIKL